MKITVPFICAALLFTAAAVSAQNNARELRFGNMVNGEIRTGGEQWYRIRHTQDSFVVVETSGEIDTMMEAYDDSINLIDSNDDGGFDLNARLEVFIAAGKTYYFKVLGYGDTSGPYSILATQKPLPRPVDLRPGAPSRNETLREGQDQWYSVTAQGAGILTVETISSIDTYLELYDTSFVKISENDDGGEDTNAKLEVYTERGKTYYFKLRGYSAEVSGTYRIIASFEEMASDTERNTERSRAVSLRLGEAFPVFMRTAGESRWYRYEAGSQTNFMVQTRGDTDTMLLLYDSNGNLITEDDDSGDGLNALISERINAGTYFIEVKTYSGVLGRFTLHAETR